jgi:hypothetical protein
LSVLDHPERPQPTFRLGEPEGEHALLLEVGLVDTSERADNDGAATEETGLEGGVLTRRTLTVVLVTDDNPGDTLVTVVGTDLGDTAELAGNLVKDLELSVEF